MKESRWRYRFDNYTKAYTVLEEALLIKEPSTVEMAGVIQFYEMAFELAWKTIKDYLQEEGFDVKSPKSALKQAIQMELIENGYDWIDALEDRNLTSHTYDEETALRVYMSIRTTYSGLLKSLFLKLQNEL